MQVQMRRISHAVMLGLALLFWGCQSPRDNPYDPEAWNYLGSSAEYGSLRGRVTTLSSLPLSGVMVFTVPGYRGSLTNSQGYYVIADLAAGSCQVICAPSGYAADTLDATILQGVETEVNIQLDALPEIMTFDVTSHYFNQPSQPFPTFYTILAQTAISEPDGQENLASVTLQLESGYSYAMQHDSTQGVLLYYSTVVEYDSLSFEEIDNVMRQQFTCLAIDAFGNSALSDPDLVRRYFTDYPSPTSPRDGVRLYDPTQPLSWEPFQASFPFSFMVQVFREEFPGGNYAIFWQQMDIPATAVSTTVYSLSNGMYYWLIEALDEYGNSARSEPAYFEIYLTP